MKTIYNAVMQQLKTEIPELKWIDLDEGQLETGDGERPAVAFPCALIGIDLPKCTTLYGSVQQCVATVTVRVAQNPPTSRTSAQAPDDARQTALERFDLVDRVHVALQGFGTDHFNELSRSRMARESRRGLFVYKIEYQTEFRDNPLP